MRLPDDNPDHPGPFRQPQAAEHDDPIGRALRIAANADLGPDQPGQDGLADALRAAAVPEPPSDLAARTVQRLRAHRRDALRRRWLMVVPLAAAAAVALVMLRPTGDAPAPPVPTAPGLVQADPPRPSGTDPVLSVPPDPPTPAPVPQPVSAHSAATVFQTGMRTYGAEAVALGQDIRGLGGFLAGFLPRPAGVERKFKQAGTGQDG